MRLATLTRYQNLVQQFLLWVQFNHVTWHSTQSLDNAVVSFMDHLMQPHEGFELLTQSLVPPKSVVAGNDRCHMWLWVVDQTVLQLARRRSQAEIGQRGQGQSISSLRPFNKAVRLQANGDANGTLIEQNFQLNTLGSARREAPTRGLPFPCLGCQQR